MTQPPLDDLPEATRLAIAYAPAALRPAYTAFYALDTRLAQIVAKANEPLLAQMRIAWWRDELRKPVSTRPEGDPVLDLIGHAWNGQEDALTALVDGWEGLLAEPPLDDGAIAGFAAGRSAPLCAMASDAASSSLVQVERAARRWALADLLLHSSDADERARIAALIDRTDKTPLPRAMRPLALLEGLAMRAVRNGEGALLGSRGASLAALRLGILGR